MSNIVITEHACERMRERLGIPRKSINKTAESAYEKGISHSETKGRLNKYFTRLYMRNKTANNIRIFGRHVYIFRSRTIITVMLLPHKMDRYVSRILNAKQIQL